MKNFYVLSIRFGHTVNNFITFGVHEVLSYGAKKEQHCQWPKEQH